MSTQTQSHGQLMGRRAELLAELFLQELAPTFLASSKFEKVPYDFFVGFPSSSGGVNAYVVEVKSTDHPVGTHYSLRTSNRFFECLTSSNIPTILLVVDVKNNRLYYAWGNSIPKPKEPPASHRTMTIKVPVVAINDSTKEELRRQLAS